LGVAVGSVEGERAYYSFNDSALNTLSSERAQAILTAGKYRLVGTQMVSVRRLDSLLGEHLPADTSMDLLSVDVEGQDLDVLQSSDWNRYRPRLVIAELLNLAVMRDVAEHPITDYLASQGYVPWAKTFHSVFFVDDRPGGPGAPTWLGVDAHEASGAADR
jgi:hypothetical protein